MSWTGACAGATSCACAAATFVRLCCCPVVCWCPACAAVSLCAVVCAAVCCCLACAAVLPKCRCVSCCVPVLVSRLATVLASRPALLPPHFHPAVPTSPLSPLTPLAFHPLLRATLRAWAEQHVIHAKRRQLPTGVSCNTHPRTGAHAYAHPTSAQMHSKRLGLAYRQGGLARQQ